MQKKYGRVFHDIDKPPDLPLETGRSSGNPQGKGLSKTLDLLLEVQSSSSLPDASDDGLARIVEDYIATLLIVSCEFKFKPVAGVEYSLYFTNNRLLLSLITPEEGGSRLFDEFVGRCSLKRDLSWSVHGVNPERLSLIFDPELLVELEKSQHKQNLDIGRLRSLLQEISNSENWRFDSRLGYYQNVLLFLVQKTLRQRLNRLRESGSQLGTEERNMLLSL